MTIDYQTQPTAASKVPLVALSQICSLLEKINMVLGTWHMFFDFVNTFFPIYIRKRIRNSLYMFMLWTTVNIYSFAIGLC